MDFKYIVEKLNSFFEVKNKEVFESESGVTYDAGNDVKKVGYCTNLTLETIEKAKNSGVDMMITHHDARKKIFGLEEACTKRLVEYGISHYFSHLPLDDCDFGTNDTLIKKLDLKCVKRIFESDGLHFGRVAECDDEIEFDELVKKVEELLEEPVKAWKFNDKKIKRVGVLCGNGGPTDCLKEAVENGCDTYITGEYGLYSILYAQLNEMNLIVGSHTFTELFGVESLVLKLKDDIKELEIVKIDEEHYEANIR